MTKLVTTVAALALAAGAIVGSSAHAETTDIVTQRIKFDRADLRTPKGADRMFVRIRDVAHHLCYDRHRAALQLRPSELYLQCVHEAVAGAVARVDEPLVTAAYMRSQLSQVAVASR